MKKLNEVEELDNVDAMVFSGDSLHNEESLELFEYCLERWSNEAKSIKEMLKERSKQTEEQRKDPIKHIIKNEKSF